MSIRHTIPILILTGALSLGGCANNGGLALTTGSLDTTSKPAPKMAQKSAMSAACSSLVTRIHTLRQEGTPARVEKVAAGKSATTVIKRSALTKLTELNKANAEFLAKCPSAPDAHLKAAAAAAAAAQAAKKPAPAAAKKKAVPKKTSAAPSPKKAASAASTSVTKKAARVATAATTAKQAAPVVKKAVTAAKTAVTTTKKATANAAPVPIVNKSAATTTVTKRVTAAAAAAAAAKVTTAATASPSLGVAFPGTENAGVITTTVPSGQ